MPEADPRVTAAFRWQADKCREMGSPFTGALLDEAAASLEAALRLYEKKGNVVSAEKTRALLAELGEPVAAPADA